MLTGQPPLTGHRHSEAVKLEEQEYKESLKRRFGFGPDLSKESITAKQIDLLSGERFLRMRRIREIEFDLEEAGPDPSLPEGGDTNAADVIDNTHTSDMDRLRFPSISPLYPPAPPNSQASQRQRPINVARAREAIIPQVQVRGTSPPAPATPPPASRVQVAASSPTVGDNPVCLLSLFVCQDQLSYISLCMFHIHIRILTGIVLSTTS